MSKRKFLIFMSLVLAVIVLFWGIDQSAAQSKNAKGKGLTKKEADEIRKARGSNKITDAERQAAAKRAKDLGLQPGVAALAVVTPDPGGVPHYFGPYGNWAYSPLPKGPVAVITVTDGGTGYTAPVVTIEDAYGTGTGAIAGTVTVDATGAITAIALGSGGTDYSAPVVAITDPTGTGATADAVIGGVLAGGIHKFIDKVPLLGPTGANSLLQPSGDFQYIPVAVPETVTFSSQAADYYEIALVEFNERMHTDLPPTRHRGYVQLETPTNAVGSRHIPLTYIDGITPIYYPGTTNQVYAFDNPHFLGPVIVATGGVPGAKDALGNPAPIPSKPVRIKFYNFLPTGTGGDLFLPVDKTVMGAGMGPDGMTDYTQNRATVHLHGNNTVWISDGTPHQWITPATENTPYPKGVSVVDVPDMPPAGDGAMTLFYTNAQTARLMFYHDHAFGITRLNVYAGEAAGYVITDQVEQDMIAGTNISGVNINCDVNNLNCARVLPDIGIPLVIQDRTFVDATTIYAQDPTWNWGTAPGTGVTGDLWYPHVYMSAQNPWDLGGTNAHWRRTRQSIE